MKIPTTIIQIRSSNSSTKMAENWLDLKLSKNLSLKNSLTQMTISPRIQMLCGWSWCQKKGIEILYNFVYSDKIY
jgi:hypothetical protein